MIWHWWFVAVVFVVGGFCGMVLMAACAAAGRADELAHMRHLATCADPVVYDLCPPRTRDGRPSMTLTSGNKAQEQRYL